MLKTIALSFILASAAVGCAAASDSSTSDQAATGTLSLADAEAQVAAARAKLEPTNAHELLFNPSLAPAYVASVRPIFERTAPTDKLALASEAFTYVSQEAQAGGVLAGGLLDDAVATTYDDIVDYGFYYGGLATTHSDFWSSANGIIARSKVGPLSDLQILEVVTTAQSHDFVAGLNALGWSKAPKATKANLIDAPQTFSAVANLLFGDLAVVPSGTTHDIAADDTFGAKLFTQTFAELRLVGSDEGVILYDLGSHFREAEEDTHTTAARGLALAKSALTAAEEQDLQRQL